MHTVEPGVITDSVERFLEPDGQPRSMGRERGWDFCFNYFQDHPEPTRDLELSCLQLGYYLASWGMLRGSSYLLRATNSSHYASAMRIIEAANPALRGIDADRYDEQDVRRLLLDTYADLKEALLPRGGRAETLVTKVMMGVWGVVPSFDTYFVRSFRALGETRAEKAALRFPGDRSLSLLGEFYLAHSAEIDGLTRRFSTVTFPAAAPGGRPLTRSKIIDIFGFQSGYEPATR